MEVQIRPDYVSPFAMLKKAAQKLDRPAAKEGGQTDRVTELQSKRQQLQNQMLLLRATGTDSAGAAAETQKEIGRASCRERVSSPV